MIKLEQHVAGEIQRCKRIHYRLSRRLSRIDYHTGSDRLTYTILNGKRYFYESWIDDGVKKRRYLGTEDNPEVRRIKEIRFLTKAIAMLDKHIERIVRCQKILHTFDVTFVNDSLPKAYRLSEEHLKQVLGPDEEELWYMKACKAKQDSEEVYGLYYPKGLKHRAKDGTLVRSKSELVIANEFFNRSKPYIYEMPTRVGQLVLHPDFKFYSTRFGRPMILEHVGMLGDGGYRSSFIEKVDTYTKNGYIPCVDVIFTFDTLDGELDAGIVSRLLDEYQ